MHRFRDWANLPSELVEDLRDRMDFPGLFKFGLISSSWRSISSPIFKPILDSLLVIQKDSYENGSLWIYNPSDATPYQIRLPPGFSKGKLCGFTNGFLVLEEEEENDGNSNLQLLRLLSSSAISLPPLPVESERKKVCLSSDLSMAMAITRNADENMDSLSAFICSLKQEEISWNVIQIPKEWPKALPVVEDVIFVKGKFYAITTDGFMVVVTASADGTYQTSAFYCQNCFDTTYLADSWEYGLIFIEMATRVDRKIRHIVSKSVEIDENFEDAAEPLISMDDLGDHAVFVSCHHSRVISTSACPSLKKNMVYNSPDPPRRLRGELIYSHGKPCRLGGRSLERRVY